MLPVILVAVGAYLIGDSVLGDKKYAKGGSVLISKEEKAARKRLEELRKELRAERISYSELAELEALKEYIDNDDIELLQAAGVEEDGYDDDYDDDKYADGGMTEPTKVVTIGEDTWYLTYIDSTHFYLSNSPDFKGSAYNIGQFRGSEPQWVWKDVKSWLKSNSKKMDDGGMMAKGGFTSSFSGTPDRRRVTKEKGGMMAKGGYVTDLDEVVASSDLKEELKSKMKKGDEIVAFSYTDYGGSFGDKVAIEYFKENHPKNIVFEETAYNGQNGIVFGEVAEDFLEETEDYPLGYEDMESFYYDMQSEQEEKDFKLFLSDIKNKYTIKKDTLDWLLENKGGYYSIEPNMVDFSYSELENELEEEGLIKRKKMAKGGKLVGKQKKLDLNKNGKLDAEDFKMLRGEKMAKGGETKDVKEYNVVEKNHKVDYKVQINPLGDYTTKWLVGIDRRSDEFGGSTHTPSTTMSKDKALKWFKGVNEKNVYEKYKEIADYNMAKGGVANKGITRSQYNKIFDKFNSKDTYIGTLTKNNMGENVFLVDAADIETADTIKKYLDDNKIEYANSSIGKKRFLVY
jgi:hypothetical protein